MKAFFRILLRIPGPLITLCSIYFSSLSTVPMPPGLSISDKLVHLVCFAGLAGGWTFWFSPESWRSRRLRNLLVCIAGVALYGILDEFHQSFVPGREVSLYDWFADVAGAVLGSVVGSFLMRGRSTMNN
jgi:VanZ family protein